MLRQSSFDEGVRGLAIPFYLVVLIAVGTAFWDYIYWWDKDAQTIRQTLEFNHSPYLPLSGLQLNGNTVTTEVPNTSEALKETDMLGARILEQASVLWPSNDLKILRRDWEAPDPIARGILRCWPIVLAAWGVSIALWLLFRAAAAGVRLAAAESSLTRLESMSPLSPGWVESKIKDWYNGVNGKLYEIVADVNALKAQFKGYSSSEDRVNAPDVAIESLRKQIGEMVKLESRLEKIENQSKPDGSVDELKKQVQSVMAKLAAESKAAEEYRKRASSELKRIEEHQAKPDASVDELRKQLQSVLSNLAAESKASADHRSQMSSQVALIGSDVQNLERWRREAEPTLNKKKQELAEDVARQELIMRASEKSRTVKARIPEPNFERGLSALANEFGVPLEILKEDARLGDSIRKAVDILKTGSTPALILEGPTGVGKTAVARSLSKFFWSDSDLAAVINQPSSHWGPELLHEFQEDAHGERIPGTVGIITEKIIECIHQNGKRWLFIDELNEIPIPFAHLFQPFKNTLFHKSGDWKLPVGTSAGAVELSVPETFRLVMAMNPKSAYIADRINLDGDASMLSRLKVVAFRPPDLKFENLLLSEWIKNDQPNRFRADRQWRLITSEVRDAARAALPAVLDVVAVARNHANHTNRGEWRFVEQGTALPRRLISDAAAAGRLKFRQALEEGIAEWVVKPAAHFHHDPNDDGIYELRSRLATHGFKEAERYLPQG